MRIELSPPWRSRRLMLVVLAVACLGVWAVAFAAMPAEATATELSPVNVETMRPAIKDTITTFGQFDLSFDAKKVVFACKKDKQTSYRIYEVGIDGTGLRPLTFAEDEADNMDRHKSYPCYGRYDDIAPCYLPGGKIIFASTRAKRAVESFLAANRHSAGTSPTVAFTVLVK